MSKYIVKFAENQQEIDKALKLRYEELVLAYKQNNTNELQTDITDYDNISKHVIAVDTETNEVVGCYRMLVGSSSSVRYVCEDEFNIDTLKSLNQPICELSRAVVKTEYRNGIVIRILWAFIINYVRENNYRFLIGDASFFDSNKEPHLNELSYLYYNHLADESFNIISKDKEQLPFLEKDKVDERSAIKSLPPLIRAYTQIGGKIAKECFSDHPFGSLDVFVIVDMQNYNKAMTDRLIRLNQN